ncbi:hypothetical protein LRP67_02965 [Nocardioides sp. cx-169]|uniref:hypothetical protein n=1 Tax=Nocardioides sp. cx-169 TaxID=2899080 RepID=UPI001E5CDCEF|nr:hypothetical protein [Nocardioides sp. cx-169]MCD4533040.1 hypothetical protein [Nocardioides sp. cx-169]
MARETGLVHQVQLSDMVFGDRSLPCRAVPGRGDLLLLALLGWLVDAGYGGVFECELSGPRIDALVHRRAAALGVEWLHGVLADLGA